MFLPEPDSYQKAFLPHCVIPQFLEEKEINAIISDFPSPDDPQWKHFKDGKKESTTQDLWPESIQKVIMRLNGNEFVEALKHLTGFKTLYADPTLYGGGLNYIEPGGKLIHHVDFNYQNEFKKYRCVNLLLYLNERCEGGDLHLIHKDTEEDIVVKPLKNTALIFNTNDVSVHGYNTVLCPEGRKSINLYYYTDECPPQTSPEPHKTIWLPEFDVKYYWNKRPCNVNHSHLQPGTKEYIDQVTAKRYKAEPHIPRFCEVEKWKGKRVLEIGGGLGTDALQFAKAGAHMTIVDLSSKSLELCKHHFKVYGLDAHFVCGNAEKLDELVSGPFDLIYSFGVIHHTASPENITRHFPQLLADGGEVRFMVYSKVSFKLFRMMREYNQWDMSQTDSLIQCFSEAQSGCPITHTYTFDEVKALVSDLKVEKIWKDHIFTWDVEAYKRHEWVKDRAWKYITPEQYAFWCQELGWHTLVICSKA